MVMTDLNRRLSLKILDLSRKKKQYKQETALDEKNNHETILLTFGLSI